MEEKLNSLNKIRVNYSKLLVQVGIQYLQDHPDNNPNEFVATYFPPAKTVHKILKKQWHENIRNHKRSELNIALNEQLKKIEAQLKQEVDIEPVNDKFFESI